MDNNELPKWHQELTIFNRIKPQIIIEGNIMDKYVYPEENDYQSKGVILNLKDYLNAFFRNLGYHHVIFYDHLKGFYNDSCDDGKKAIDDFAALVSEDVTEDHIAAPFSGRGANAAEIIDLALGYCRGRMFHPHSRHGHNRCYIRNGEITYISLIRDLGHGKEQVVVTQVQFSVGRIDTYRILSSNRVAQCWYLLYVTIIQEGIGKECLFRITAFHICWYGDIHRAIFFAATA